MSSTIGYGYFVSTACYLPPLVPVVYYPASVAVMELDWRGLAAAFKSPPADIILGSAPGALLDIQL